MKTLTLTVLGLVCLALIASLSSRDDPSQKTAVMTQMAKKLERAKRIDPATKLLMGKMIEDVRRGGPYSDSRLESQMQAAIDRVETALGGRTAFVNPK